MMVMVTMIHMMSAMVKNCTDYCDAGCVAGCAAAAAAGVMVVMMKPITEVSISSDRENATIVIGRTSPIVFRIITAPGNAVGK